MEELVNKLNEAAEAYYNGKEIMSNFEYDELFDELKALEEKEGRVLPNSPTRNVGAKPVDSLPKFTHTYPALSLDKTKSVEEFVNKFRKGIAESGSDNDNVVLMWKEDGSTVQAYYTDGRLRHLVTRGNGEVGTDITHNAKAISGLPLTIKEKGEVIVRGEALISYSDFNFINAELPDEQQFKNPRNLASASITMLDSQEVKDRKVHVKAFNLVKFTQSRVTDALSGYRISTSSDDFLDSEAPKLRQTFSGRLDILKHLGFDVVEHVVSPVDELSKHLEEWTHDAKNYEYPVDGLVAAMDDYEYSFYLTGTEHHPHIMNGYAFKWTDETYETILREIEWSPSRTGLLNPVAIFDPVEIDGTTVSRASLHNLSVTRELNLRIGDTITVFKANQIIPQVAQNLNKDDHDWGTFDADITEHIVCPTCGSKAIVNTSPEGIQTVYCPNENCKEKVIGRLTHFCSRDSMDIQGMSEETLVKLYDAGFVKQYSDLFNLDKKPGIAFLPGFGKQSWSKLCKSAEVARKTDFVKFVTAIGIPGVGKGQAKSLLNYISENYEKLSDLFHYDNGGQYNPVELLRYLGGGCFDFSLIPGFGDVLHSSIRYWCETNFSLNVDSEVTRVHDMLEFTDNRKTASNTVSTSISGKSFCITGKLINFSNRQDLVSVIENNGGKWVDSVSSKTDYLINNDTESTSGKNKKAKELGIPIISEEQFLALISKEDN